MIFVTFLYELDRSSWPLEWQRPFSNYLERLDKLLPKLSDTIIFGEDDRVKEIAMRHNKHYISKPKEEWDAWKNKRLAAEIFSTAKAVDFRYDFSADYNCLQLSKFDAIKEAVNLFPTDKYIWIDGGLKEEMLPEKIEVLWKNNLIHVSLLKKPQDDFFVMGATFGGLLKDMLWLSNAVEEENRMLLSNGQCMNDQQILSIVFNKNPKRFFARRAYVIYATRTQEKWSNVTYCLNDHLPQLPDYFSLYCFISIIIIILIFILV